MASQVRTSLFQSGARAEATVPAARSADIDLGPPAHPFADLARLAALLSGHAPEPGQELADATLPGPEQMQAQAERLGLVLRLHDLDLLRLEVADCPCVVLLREGGSRLVVEVTASREAVLLGADQVVRRVALVDLAKVALGSVFVVRPARELAPAGPALSRHPSAGEPSFDPSSFGPSSSGIPRGPPEVSARQTLIAHVRAAAAARPGIVPAMLLAGALSNLFALALPLFTMAVFDRIIPHAAFETLWALATGLVVLLLLDMALRQTRQHLMEAVALETAHGLGAKLFHRLLRMPFDQSPRDAGRLVQPVAEFGQLPSLALQLAVAALVDLPFFVIVLLLLATLGGPIALIPVLGLGLVVAAQALSHRAITSDTSEEVQLLGRQVQAIIDSVLALQTFKVTGAEDARLALWERRADAAAHVGFRHRALQHLAVLISAFAAQIVTVGVLVVGVYLVAGGQMSIGALSACMLLAARSLPPMLGLSGLVFRVRLAERVTAPVAALLAAPAEIGLDATQMRQAPHTPLTGAVRLAHVSFSHGGSPRPVLNDLSLALRPGERVGLVGRSGCGKSTLLRLMVRLHEPQAGHLLLDEAHAGQVDPIRLRRAFALMTQETVLVDGSLLDNLTLGLERPDRASIEAIAIATGVAEIARAHPQGYSLPVGPGGRNLSGGARQMVALARALAGAPRMLLLDEPTAAMDNEREARIVALLKDLPPETGLVVATHRLPLLAAVDRIIWLDEGRIVADGPRDEVFRRFGMKAA